MMQLRMYNHCLFIPCSAELSACVLTQTLGERGLLFLFIFYSTLLPQQHLAIVTS
jgi:hypothetical protein